MTEASTLAGEDVFGSLSSEITDSRIVLQGSSELLPFTEILEMIRKSSHCEREEKDIL